MYDISPAETYHVCSRLSANGNRSAVANISEHDLRQLEAPMSRYRFRERYVPPAEPDAGWLTRMSALRRSRRDFLGGVLPASSLVSILNCAYGATGPGRGYRLARRPVPSAGALYPLLVYAMAIKVTGIPAGVHYYDPVQRGLALIRAADLRRPLVEICLAQAPAESAAAAVLIGASLRRMMAKYGERGYRYVLLEAGHAAQNICLAAAELRLGLLPIGAFADDNANCALGLDGVDEAVLYILLIGDVPSAPADPEA